MNDSFDNMTQMQNEIEQTIAMNPNLSIEELNVVAQHKMAQLNNQPNDDFCGISPVQMSNWMYAPWNELTEVNSTRQKI